MITFTGEAHTVSYSYLSYTAVIILTENIKYTAVLITIVMNTKAKKNEAGRVAENGQTILPEPDEEQQEDQREDPKKQLNDDSLSEKFFLSDSPED